MGAHSQVRPELYDEVAYLHDGTLEGLLSAIFEAYANKEDPTDMGPDGLMQPRLSQRMHYVATNEAHAERVRAGIIRACGQKTFWHIVRASTSSDPQAGYAIYRFIRYAMDAHTGRGRALSNRAHPDVSRLLDIVLSVDNECEKMRQFARFEHLKDEDTGSQLWLAKINPKHAVVPLVLGHFVERFNVQPFILYDETHHVAGIWDGRAKRLARVDAADLLAALPERSAAEVAMQEAWRTFYRAVSIDARYNPELRRGFMPMRLWKNITEMQEDVTALTRRRSAYVR